MYKYHALLSKTSEIQLIIESHPIASSCCEKLLGVKIDQKILFEPHVESLCKNSSKKHQCSVKDGIFFKVQTKKVIIKRIYYSPILLCTSSIDVSF